METVQGQESRKNFGTLVKAIRANDLKTIETQFIEHNANPKWTYKTGTLLYCAFATQRPNLQTIELLLKHGVSPHSLLKRPNIETPLGYCAAKIAQSGRDAEHYNAHPLITFNGQFALTPDCGRTCSDILRDRMTNSLHAFQRTGAESPMPYTMDAFNLIEKCIDGTVEATELNYDSETESVI